MHDAYLNTLVDEIESRGLRRDDVIEEPAGRVSAAHLARVLRRALDLSGDPGLAVTYGLRLNLASHGMLGYALMSSRNGEQLLGLLSRYASLAVPGLVLRRVVESKRTLLACEAIGGELSREFLTDLVLATLVGGARALFNRRIPGAQIWFDYARPAHAASYAVFGVPVRFSQPYSALVCDREFLVQPLPSANPVMLEIGARQCDDMLRAMRERTGLAGQIRRVLLRAPGTFPSQTELAPLLHMSPRTLRRQLGAQGARYREIVDEVRFELAKRYLKTPQLRVAQISALLGYDEVANFRRAFKRWSGASPNTWRAEGVQTHLQRTAVFRAATQSPLVASSALDAGGKTR
jgi:AraC-like DNA-binding protein